MYREIHKVALNKISGCQDVGGTDCDFWSLLVALPRLLPRPLSHAWHDLDEVYPTCLPCLLLAGHVPRCRQPRRLLPHESKVSSPMSAEPCFLNICHRLKFVASSV